MAWLGLVCLAHGFGLAIVNPSISETILFPQKYHVGIFKIPPRLQKIWLSNFAISEIWDKTFGLAMPRFTQDHNLAMNKPYQAKPSHFRHIFLVILTLFWVKNPKTGHVWFGGAQILIIYGHRSWNPLTLSLDPKLNQNTPSATIWQRYTYNSMSQFSRLCI